MSHAQMNTVLLRVLRYSRSICEIIITTPAPKLVDLLIDMAMKETRIVRLPKGGELEFTVMPGFYERVRAHFGLAPGAVVEDDHLRMFVFGSLKNAVDKVEGATTT